MASQVQKRTPQQEHHVETWALAAEDAAAQKRVRKEQSDKITDISDELMSDIDELLEDVLANETAAQFVKGFRQSPGE